MDQDNVFDYIISEENNFKVQRVPICEGWDWSFYEHIKRSTLMKNSRYEDGSLGDKPFKNIIRPILNVAYRTENIDVKDVEPYVNDPDNYYKSFLTRRFHGPFARKYNLDTYFDDVVESYVDYGIAISENVNEVAPKVLKVQEIAFCDQTNIEAGPLCKKVAYGVDELLAMKGIWDSTAIDTVITMARPEKTNDQSAGSQKAKTPGKYIEVYQLDGMLPKKWRVEGFEGNDMEKARYVVCFYYSPKQKKRVPITLYKGRTDPKKKVYKTIVRDPIWGRCAGFGGIEELFDPQVWINYDAIQIKEMLDVAAQMISVTTDPAFETRNNKINEMVKGQIVVVKEGHTLSQYVQQPINIEKFNAATAEWLDIARTMGFANAGLLGKNPSAGTPFRLQDAVNEQGLGLHEYRQGKIATYLGEIYRDWILQSLVDDMNSGHKFVDNLTLDELQEIADTVVSNTVDRKVRELILDNKMVTREVRDQMISLEKEKFMKAGSKRFIEVLKDEIAKLPVDVEVNIAGKQKDLNKISVVLTNVFRQVIANPEVLKNPAIAKIFNDLLEASGMSSLDFATLTKGAPALPPQPVQPADNAAPVPSNVSVVAPAPVNK